MLFYFVHGYNLSHISSREAQNCDTLVFFILIFGNQLVRYREEEIGCKTRKGASGLVRHVIDLAASNVTSDCVVEMQKFRERKRQHNEICGKRNLT